MDIEQMTLEQQVEYWKRLFDQTFTDMVNRRNERDSLQAERDALWKSREEFSQKLAGANRLLDIAFGWLNTMSSADGSGHRDLALRLQEMRQEPPEPSQPAASGE